MHDPFSRWIFPYYVITWNRWREKYSWNYIREVAIKATVTQASEFLSESNIGVKSSVCPILFYFSSFQIDTMNSRFYEHASRQKRLDFSKQISRFSNQAWVFFLKYSSKNWWIQWNVSSRNWELTWNLIGQYYRTSEQWFYQSTRMIFIFKHGRELLKWCIEAIVARECTVKLPNQVRCVHCFQN